MCGTIPDSCVHFSTLIWREIRRCAFCMARWQGSVLTPQLEPAMPYPRHLTLYIRTAHTEKGRRHSWGQEATTVMETRCHDRRKGGPREHVREDPVAFPQCQHPRKRDRKGAARAFRLRDTCAEGQSKPGTRVHCSCNVGTGNSGGAIQEEGLSPKHSEP